MKWGHGIAAATALVMGVATARGMHVSQAVVTCLWLLIAFNSFGRFMDEQ